MIDVSQLSVRAVLFESDNRDVGLSELTRMLAERDVADRAMGSARVLTGPARRALDGEIASALAGVLDLGLEDIVAAGWRSLTELHAAATRTWNKPGSREVVTLADHRTSASQHPWIELQSSGTALGRMDFDVTEVFDIKGVVAIVANGMMVGARYGHCSVKVTLGMRPLGTITERHRDLPIDVVVPLRRPLPLLARRSSIRHDSSRESVRKWS